MSNDKMDVEEDDVIRNRDVFFLSNLNIIYGFVQHCGKVKVHVHAMPNLTNYNFIPKKAIVIDGSPPNNGQHLTLCWEKQGSVKMDNYAHPTIKTLTTEDLITIDAFTKKSSYETIHNFDKKNETPVYHLFLVNLNPIVFFSVISLQSFVRKEGDMPTKISKDIIYRKVPFTNGQLSKCIYDFVDVIHLLYILENKNILKYILEREFSKKEVRGVKWTIIEPYLKNKDTEVASAVKIQYEEIIQKNYECSNYFSIEE